MKFCEIKLTHVAKKKKKRKTLHENITDCLIILYVGCPRFFYQTLSLYSMERDKEKCHINVCHWKHCQKVITQSDEKSGNERAYTKYK